MRRGQAPALPTNLNVIWRTNEDVRPYAVFARENRCNLLRGAESTPPTSAYFHSRGFVKIPYKVNRRFKIYILSGAEILNAVKIFTITLLTARQRFSRACIRLSSSTPILQAL